MPRLLWIILLLPLAARDGHADPAPIPLLPPAKPADEQTAPAPGPQPAVAAATLRAILAQQYGQRRMTPIPMSGPEASRIYDAFLARPSKAK